MTEETLTMQLMQTKKSLQRSSSQPIIYVSTEETKASLTFKAMHTETPPYLSRLPIPYRPSRVLRLASSYNLFLAPILTSVLALSIQLPHLFETLFLAQSILPIHSTFWRHLKMHLFQAAFNTHSGKLQTSDSFM